GTQYAVQLDPRQPQSVHALQLERRIDQALELRLHRAAFDVDALDGGLPLRLRGDADLLGDGDRDVHQRRPGIDDEVVRSLAVDLDAHHDVARVGQAERDGVRLAGVLVLGLRLI